jgi:hypothetical protein
MPDPIFLILSLSKDARAGSAALDRLKPSARSRG